MSRIGGAPIPVPSGVDVKIDGSAVSVKGGNGELNFEFHDAMSIVLEDGVLTVSRPSDEPKHRALHGLTRSLLNNMVVGVSEGFVKKLEINGVGFKAMVSGSTVTMNLGYSHPIKYDLPDQVTVSVDKDTSVTIEGPDKQKVGLVAAELRGFYPVEPYKGKGVKYADEHVRRKEGKTVQ